MQEYLSDWPCVVVLSLRCQLLSSIGSCVVFQCSVNARGLPGECLAPPGANPGVQEAQKGDILKGDI